MSNSKRLFEGQQPCQQTTLQHHVGKVVIDLAKGENKGLQKGYLDAVRSALPASFVAGEQHDAHEVLVSLHNSEIFECFQRTETSQFVCKDCSFRWEAADGKIKNSILHLSLPQRANIPVSNKKKTPSQHIWSLREWVRLHFQGEDVEYVCPQAKCGSTGPKHHYWLLESAPNFLCIQLAYFDANEEHLGAFGRRKAARKWNDFENLELEVCTQDSLGNEGPASIVKYRVYGIIFHHGPYVSGGHYTFAGCASGCAGREKCDGQIIKEGRATASEASWYYWDDDTVAGPYTRDIACAAASRKNYNGGRAVLGEGCNSPYLLFYTRVADPSYQPSQPDCSVCTHGHEWRSALEAHR